MGDWLLRHRDAIIFAPIFAAGGVSYLVAGWPGAGCWLLTVVSVITSTLLQERLL